ncbi:MAG: PEP-CTERM sorting domain-containing protein [Planctomycetota bacterium]
MRMIALVALWMCIAETASAATLTLHTPPSGDATYAWNTKYGPSGYGAGADSVGIYLYFGAPYGNDYTVSIFEVPIAALAGETVTAASLQVESLGFGTNYYYGSARIGWLNTGSTPLSGDVVADALGPLSTSLPGGMTLFDTGYVAGDAGAVSFDVLDCVLADLAAGRDYSTFVMSGSRETWGSICAAESGSGPRIVAEVASVPEPSMAGLLAGAGLAVLAFRRKSRGKTGIRPAGVQTS